MFLAELEAMEHENIMVVSHGAFGRALVRVIQNLDPQAHVEFMKNATPLALI